MYVDCRDDDNNPIADISVSRINISAHYQSDAWRVGFGTEYRQHKDDVASSEKQTPSAWIGQFSIGYQLNKDTSLGFFVDNLFDEEYFTSADDIVPYAEGRDFGLTFKKHW
ncbi:hypothetical protein GCM10009123_07060 [Kangiella japonica]|uniref:TonB-dependent receptor-like beta-barrel domain-containing protein n=1 Tax=Kangiella japonica TaxID=647384 RepID=A0ABP3CFL2_9GAMM